MRQIFTRILLPLLLPVLLAAWIYVFVLAVRELAASVFLVGTRSPVLGTIRLTMWEEGGSYGAVSALGVIQIIPLIMIVAGLRWLELRVQRRAEASAAKARIAAGYSVSSRYHVFLTKTAGRRLWHPASRWSPRSLSESFVP